MERMAGEANVNRAHQQSAENRIPPIKPQFKPSQAMAMGLLFAPSGIKRGIGWCCVSNCESAVREAQRWFCDDVVVGVVIEGGGALEGILR